MKEKEILKGKVLSKYKFIPKILIIGIILGLIVFYIMLINEKELFESEMCALSFDLCEYVENKSPIEYAIDIGPDESLKGGLITTGGFLVCATFFYLLCSTQKIIITNKRVYGIKFFGVRFDIPLDSISSIGKIKLFKGIFIASSSKKMFFCFIKNDDNVYNAISELLVNRQDKKQNESMVEKKDYIEELKKLKELMNDDVITKEEFEKKKKELLK